MSVTASSTQLPKGWTRLTMGEVGRWFGGGTPSKANPRFWTGGKIPWVSPKDMKFDLITDAQDHITEDAVAQSATNLVEAGSILIVVRSGILQHTLPVAVASRQVALNQDLKAVKPLDNIRSDYLALALKAFERDILHTCTKTGTTVQSLELPVFLRFQIPVAPLPMQRQIVAEIEKQFTRLESGVAALRRVQANLKRYRAAVLKAACEGKLVSTEAALAKKGNQKSKFEAGEALLARILTERRQNWQGHGKYKEPAAADTANLPSLPDGWTTATVEQLSMRVQYGSSAKTNEDATGVPVLRMGNIQEGKFDFEKLKYLPKAHNEFPELLLARGDLLFNRTNSAELVGKTAVFKDTPQPCSFASYLIRVRFGNGCLPDLVSYFINSVFGRAWIADVVSQQVGQANVNGTKLQALAIPLPPFAEQTRIVAEVERRLSVVEELESVVSANLQRAPRLRQSILHKAFSGELVATMPAIQISDIIPPLKPEHINRPNSHFARAVLSAEIVHRLHCEPTFGRIKHQKIFHLCEHIAQIEEIHGQYHREAAGPLDNKLIYANEAELKKQKWYQEVRRESYGHAYQALAKAGGHRKYVERYWADKLPLVEKIIELMRKWDTERCEIFCTAYAAWNDLILWGKQATEDNILHEILERWHDSKKRFPKDRWLKAIAWMKKEGFVPTGFGKPTNLK